MGVDTGTTMSDTMAVAVDREDLIDQESWAVVPDPLSRANVLDPLCDADVDADLTDCVVILTSL